MSSFDIQVNKSKWSKVIRASASKSMSGGCWSGKRSWLDPSTEGVEMCIVA